MRHAANSSSHRLATPVRANGFTLLELLIVIGIIAVLLGILLPVLGGVRNAARTATSESLVREVVTASQSYMIDNRRPPGHFSQRDLGATPNVARGFTAMENALLDLSGGLVENPSSAAVEDDNSLLRVGPFASVNDNVLVDTLAIGGQDGPGYLRLGDNAMYPVLGQATNIDMYRPGGEEIMKGMPDIVDPFGTPLMMWVQDSSGGPVNTIEDFARNAYSAGNQVNSRFYYITNIGYLQSGNSGFSGSARAQRGLGENEVNQHERSLLGAARSPERRQQNMTAILGSPAFPSESNPSLPSTSRGEVVVISAGRNRVFFENPDRTPGAGDSDNLSIGFGPQRWIPGSMERAASSVQEFNDIIQSTGG